MAANELLDNNYTAIPLLHTFKRLKNFPFITGCRVQEAFYCLPLYLMVFIILFKPRAHNSRIKTDINIGNEQKPRTSVVTMLNDAGLGSSTKSVNTIHQQREH
ncbi:hypothetical protein GQX74_013182 [Glossina fuscipes]|nr:hypothetical protein GQX74_013182 [Glossina fuscipes]